MRLCVSACAARAARCRTRAAVTTWHFEPLIDARGQLLPHKELLEKRKSLQEAEKAHKYSAHIRKKVLLEDEGWMHLRAAATSALLTASLWGGMINSGAATDPAAALELASVEAELQQELALVRRCEQRERERRNRSIGIGFLRDSLKSAATTRRALRLLDAYLAQHSKGAAAADGAEKQLPGTWLGQWAADLRRSIQLLL